MNIRAASEKDYDDIMSLMKQLNPEDPVIDTTQGKKLYSSILDAEGLSIYVVEIDSKMVAACYLNVMPNLTRGGQPYALIENVVTDANHRRCGIGTSLLKEVITRAFSLGCYKIMLLTGRESTVHNFYENCGLEKISKTAFIIRSTL